MPKRIVPLTDVRIRTAKTAPKDVKLFDGGGLYLLISPTGGKLWRFKYRFDGKEKLLTLGSYPESSLSEARLKREEARRQIAQGIDPGAVKKAQKAAQTHNAETFEVIAREWHAKFTPSWADSHGDKIIRRLELKVFPWLGGRPVGAITAQELLTVIRRMEAQGHIETAHRALQNCGQVFRYAVATGWAERDPSGDLRGALPPARHKNMATLTEPREIAGLLRAIDEYSGAFIVKCALRLAPLVFLRPGELRRGEWVEINFDAGEWRIPIVRMKRRLTDKMTRQGDVHIVPLSRQALEILRELHPVTGDGRFLFPGLRSKDRAISDMTLLNGLRRMGYSGEEMTVHGFRHMASTLLHEQGFDSRLIEIQLSHSDQNRIRAVYNYAEHLPARRKMMQAWADYLDKLKRGAEIIPLRAAG